MRYIKFHYIFEDSFWDSLGIFVMMVYEFLLRLLFHVIWQMLHGSPWYFQRILWTWNIWLIPLKKFFDHHIFYSIQFGFVVHFHILWWFFLFEGLPFIFGKILQDVSRLINNSQFSCVCSLNSTIISFNTLQSWWTWCDLPVISVRPTQ